jgi:alpha-tubulin suppressor-like RCC1 family protein
MNRDLLRILALAIVAALLPACGVSGGGTLTPTIAPGIPSTLTARGGNGSVMLDWAETAEGAQYTVQRSLLPGGPFFPVSVPDGFQGSTRYVDSGLTNGTTYYYQVLAQNSFGQSPASTTASGTPGFKALAIAGSNSDYCPLALLRDGSVWEWGVSPDQKVYTTPHQVPGLSDVTSISVGLAHALALRVDGTVWAWGINFNGDLGLGALGSTDVPLQIPDLTGIVAISAGGKFSMAVTHDGNVFVWGTNAEGELGTGQTVPASASAPQLIAGLSDIVAVSAGGTHGLALRSDGLVFSWGDNTTGELGLGTKSSTPGPVAQVPDLSGIVAISAGVGYNLALRSDGTVCAWGDNSYAQLGINPGTVNPGDPASILVPTPVPGMTGVVSIATAGLHSSVAHNDGSVWTWGYNYYGVLGYGTPGEYVMYPTPAKANVVNGAVRVAEAYGSTLALEADGTVWIWGDNFQGELGTGNGETVNKPIQMLNVTGATTLAGGNSFTLFARDPGTAYGVGETDYGQLGDGGGVYFATSGAFVISGPTGVTSLAAGDGHGLGLTSAGECWAWGKNNLGQVGNGSTIATGVQQGPKPVKVIPSGVVAVAAGPFHSMAIRKDPVTGVQTVWTWGYNQYGTCGLGNTTNPVTTPTQVPNLTGVVGISGGLYHSLAVLDDGTVWAWGGNAYGSLGQQYDVVGNGLWSTTPMKVPGISSAVAVAAGDNFSLALLADGTILAWGAGDVGQLGAGGNANAYGQTPVGPTPLQVLNLTGVVGIAAGDQHALALKSDGTVWSWGLNLYGQLGNDVSGATGTATPVENITGAVQIACGKTHSMARLSNGTLWLWGQNQWAQLGIAPLDATSTPIILTH